MSDKCEVCKCDDEPVMAWQPLGPDVTGVLSVLGSHYRGFPVFRICRSCVDDVRNNRAVEFAYKGQRYMSRWNVCRPIPEYVSDALLWSEEWTTDEGGIR